MDYTSNFFNDLTKNTYEIPLQYKIYGLILISVILLELYYVIIKKIPVSSKYIKWGFAFILLNIVNIIIISQIYLKKKGKYIGAIGEKGDHGDKGDEGDNTTCKLCDYNIYLQRTNRYDMKLAFSIDVFTLIYGQNFNYISIKNRLDHENLNVDELIRDIYSNKISGLSGLTNLIERPQLILMYDLLQNVKPEFKKMVIKTPGRKRGFTPIGDTILADDDLTESFVYNGDIRYPTSFNKLTSLYAKEKDTTVKYNIYSLNAPDGYEGLSVMLFPDGFEPEKNQYVCLNKKCIKPAEIQDLTIEYIYPDNETGFISFWSSQYNTLHINHAQLSDIKDNMRLAEILKNYNDEIYYESGVIKKEVYKQLESFFDNIKIGRLTALSYILSSYMEGINTSIRNFITKYQELLDLNLGIYTNMNKIDYFNIIGALNKIDNELTRVENEYKATKSSQTETPIEEIIETGLNIEKTLFTARKKYDKINSTINYIPVYIQNTHTLLDLINNLFMSGLRTRIKPDNITIHQRSLIYLLKVVIPPDVNVFIPQNRCLVYEYIDEDRIGLIDKCEKIIEKYNVLVEQVNGDNRSLFSEKERSVINKMIHVVRFKFDNNFSNIIDYDNKILIGDFTDFTDNQLEILLSEYTKVIEKINEYSRRD